MKFFTWGDRALIAGINLLGIFLFGGFGFLIDRFSHTDPLFLVLGILLSFPLSQIPIVRLLKARHQKRDKNSLSNT
ncbi:MAG: hypothetical protein Q8P82_00365 [bacterium]|nr:hypothetical protein [bacterium]